MEKLKVIKHQWTKDKIKRIKNFKWFMFIGFIASVFMIGFSVFLYYMESEDSFVPISIFLATTLGLWIIMFIEYISVFKSDFFLGKAWEERQIEKFINRDNKEL